MCRREREQEESEEELCNSAPSLASPSKAKEALKTALQIKQEPIDITEEEEDEEDGEASSLREVRETKIVFTNSIVQIESMD